MLIYCLQHCITEMKSIQSSSTVNTKAFDTAASLNLTFDTTPSINLRPPPIDRHKSFDEDDFSKKPIVAKKAYAAPINVTSYSVADLQMATGSFNVENLLGEGSFGRVYRAQFDDGKVWFLPTNFICHVHGLYCHSYFKLRSSNLSIMMLLISTCYLLFTILKVLAVKKIDSSALRSEFSEEFTEMVSNISQLHHQNVTELVGYCSEHGQHLLVYEFHKNGSLHEFLHLSDDYNQPLTWNSRVKIALGTARALE